MFLFLRNLFSETEQFISTHRRDIHLGAHWNRQPKLSYAALDIKEFKE